MLYEVNKDLIKHLTPGKSLHKEAAKEFGAENTWLIPWSQRSSSFDFPVLMNDGTVVSSLQVSKVLREIPALSGELVVISSDVDRRQAIQWLEQNKDDILSMKE